MNKSEHALMMNDIHNEKKEEDRRNWCFGPEGHCRIAALLRHLRDSDDGLTLERAIEIVERPWRWTDEYETMLRGGS